MSRSQHSTPASRRASTLIVSVVMACVGLAVALTTLCVSHDDQPTTPPPGNTLTVDSRGQGNEHQSGQGAPGVMEPGSGDIPRPGAPARSVHAGSDLVIHTASGKALTCTLTGTGRSQAGQLWGLTAGHCLNVPDVVLVTDSHGLVVARDTQLKHSGFRADIAEMVRLDGSTTPTTDIGWFPLLPGVEADNVVFSSKHTGNSSADDEAEATARAHNPPVQLGEPYGVDAVNVGATLCKDGRTTGRTCGKVLGVNTDTGEITMAIDVQQGDSGGPLHMMGADGKAHVVGLLSSGSALGVSLFDAVAQHYAELGVSQ